MKRVSATTIKLCFIGLLFLVMNVHAQTSSGFNNWFAKWDGELYVCFTEFDTSYANTIIHREKIRVSSEQQTINIKNTQWLLQSEILTSHKATGAHHLNYSLTCIKGNASNTSVSLILDFKNWKEKNYVFMPAAAYNGNRVKSQRYLYCPFLFDARDFGVDKPQVVSDIPRLNINTGPSSIIQRTGDMSTPAIGFYDSSASAGFLMLVPQQVNGIDAGLSITENNNRSTASFSFDAPVVREKYQYYIANMQAASTDKPFQFKQGDSIQLHAAVYFFKATCVQDMYNYFASIKNDVVAPGKVKYSVPLSVSFDIIEEKFNRQNFVPDYGYYSVGLRENDHQNWQIGWVGGMISTYPLFLNGIQNSKDHVIRNFDWLFPNGISPSGYFWDTGDSGKIWTGIFQEIPLAKDLHLVRKSGDGLYYVLKQFSMFQQAGVTIKNEWSKGTKQVADAFVKTWDRYHQLGQYVHNVTGEIIIGGSCSGGIVPAALTLAADYFRDSSYLRCAKSVGDYYYQNFVSKGLIYGGVGDAMQNFDSESCYGLLESYIILYDYTKDEKWLNMAEDVAMQFNTWISSYDYLFPAKSLLGSLGKTTTGVVWANTQNKHGAPGICTHSGISLLKLYRATGNKYYAALLQQITQAIPQYLSTRDNPIEGLQPGWVSERVSTTDWLEGIGEIFPGSTWAETSLMLTAAEIPGIYIQKDAATIICFDQVTAKIIAHDKKKIRIEIFNPTRYDASFSIMAENNKAMEQPLGNLPLLNVIKIKLRAGEKKQISLNK